MLTRRRQAPASLQLSRRADGTSQVPSRHCHRSITAVLDSSLPTDTPRPVAALLDALSLVGLAELRTAVASATAAGRPRFRCAQCRAPVALVQLPASPDAPADGRSAFFRHASGRGARACSWRSGSRLREIGAVQFAGRQEGQTHAGLKQDLAECLAQDPTVTDIQIERQIAEGDTWRQPDVSAVMGGQRVAFDLQLASAPLSTILERGAFYARTGIRHVWLTDAAALGRLSRLAFRDLHLTMGGRIFAIDDEVVAACRAARRFQLKELRLTPRLAPPLAPHNSWAVTVVGAEVILMDPVRRKQEGEADYQLALSAAADRLVGAARQAIRANAAAGGPLSAVQSAWHVLADALHGQRSSTASVDRVDAVLAWLQHVERYALPTMAQPPAPELLQQRTARLFSRAVAAHWAPLLELVGQLVPDAREALTPAQRALLTTLLTAQHDIRPVLRAHSGMLAVLYPWLGFRLLAKPPRYAPSLAQHGGDIAVQTDGVRGR